MYTYDGFSAYRYFLPQIPNGFVNTDFRKSNLCQNGFENEALITCRASDERSQTIVPFVVAAAVYAVSHVMQFPSQLGRRPLISDEYIDLPRNRK